MLTVHYGWCKENQAPKIICIPNPKYCKPTNAIIITVIYNILVYVCV